MAERWRGSTEQMYRFLFREGMEKKTLSDSHAWQCDYTFSEPLIGPDLSKRVARERCDWSPRLKNLQVRTSPCLGWSRWGCDQSQVRLRDPHRAAPEPDRLVNLAASRLPLMRLHPRGRIYLPSMAQQNASQHWGNAFLQGSQGTTPNHKMSPR